MLLERGILLNNRYRIVEILGQGGMGSVYRAIDENLGLEVAVKDNLFTTDEYARQFRREALILAGLRHPNLPRVTDHFIIHGQGQYLVMDFIEGEDLRERMERIGVLPDEDVVTIGAAVCEALSYLSSRNPPIIHRDLKPGNVKITPQGNIYLVDFGLAKTLDFSQETTTGARAMTPGYSPPEQYGTARTDHRSDIYSLGATLYAALTGSIPEDALSRAMEQTALTPVRKHNPRVSKKLALAMEKALAVRPDDRFQTADDFKQALLSSSSVSRRLVNEYVITPPPDGSIEFGAVDGDDYPGTQQLKKADDAEEAVRTIRENTPVNSINRSSDPKLTQKKPKSKNRFSGWLMSFFVVLMIGLVVLTDIIFPGQIRDVVNRIIPGYYHSVVGLVQSNSPTKLSELALATTNPTGIPILPSFTPSPTLTATPTDTLLLISTDNPPTATSVPTITPTTAPTAIGGGGSKIAFASDSTGIPQIYYLWANNGIITKVTDMPEGACQPDWSPDGKKIVFISPCDTNKDYYPGSSLYIINIDGTGLLPLPTMSGGDFDPDWSPDGTLIVFTSLRNNGRIQLYLINLEDNSISPLSEKYSFDMQPSWSKDGKRIVFISTRRGDPQIWVMDSDGGNQELFSHSTGLKNYHPNWTPDGGSIVFTQYVADNGIPRAMIAPFDLENYAEYKLGKENMPMREVVVSPDGYWIAYEGWLAGTSHDIYIMTASGAGRQQLTTDLRTDFDPIWCPDL